MSKSRLSQLAVAIVAIVATSASAASAEHTVVLPSLATAAQKGLSTQIDAVLVEEASKLSPSSALGSISFDELALVSGCSSKDRSCRTTILSTVKAERVITAELDASGSKLAVRLHVVTANGAVQTEIVKVSTDEQTIGNARATIRRMLGAKDRPSLPEASDSVDKAPDVVPPDPPNAQGNADHMPLPIAQTQTPETLKTPETQSDAMRSGSFSNIKPTTWAVIGGGGVALTSGIIFLALANSKQSQIDAAPTESIEDVRALVELEDSAKFRSRLGFAFVGVGVTAIVVGGILATRDVRQGPAQVSLVPYNGGLVVGIGGSL